LRSLPAGSPAAEGRRPRSRLYVADPVADITVLGAPDNQSLGDECGQYEAFVEALPPFDVAPPSPPSRMRFAGFKDQPPAFPSVEVAFTASRRPLCWVSRRAGRSGGGTLTRADNGRDAPGDQDHARLAGGRGPASPVFSGEEARSCQFDSWAVHMYLALAFRRLRQRHRQARGSMRSGKAKV
jgi:hypothetical protein